jgi:hypothetical protein
VRLVVGLLTCLSLGALAPALANDPAPAGSTAPSAPALDAAAASSAGASTPASAIPSSNAKPSTTPGSEQPGASPSGQATTTGQTAPTGQTPSASPPAAGATTTATSQSKTSELTPAEKDLLAQGYKLEMRGTDKHFCRSQAELGTRFTHRVCITAEQAAATKRSSQDFLNDVQRPSGNNPNK